MCAERFHVKNYIDILDPGRVATTAQARAFAMFILRQKHCWTHAKIGQAFGRDYSTCVHACQKINRAIDDAEWIKQIIES